MYKDVNMKKLRMENRIALLSNRNKENYNIIRKLNRQLRNLNKEKVE